MKIDWKKIRIKMVEQDIPHFKDLARGAKIHVNTIGAEGTFRSDTVDKLAAFLNCHPFDLIAVEGVNQHPSQPN